MGCMGCMVEGMVWDMVVDTDYTDCIVVGMNCNYIVVYMDCMDSTVYTDCMDYNNHLRKTSRSHRKMMIRTIFVCGVWHMDRMDHMALDIWV